MNTEVKTIPPHFTPLALVAVLLGVTVTARGEAGHFAGGVMDIRDYFVPPEPGFYGAVYNYFYTSDRYNDQQGNKINSITVGPNQGTTLNVGVNLDMYVLAPAFIWVSPWEILGAKYAAYISPAFANANIEANISTARGRSFGASESTFAPGDLYVQPLWLGWSQPHWDVSAAYGFYAPVGKYDTKTLNLPSGSVAVPDASNIGLGYWSQQFQGGVAWYPWTNKATAVTAVMTYNYNSEQEGTGTKPGQLLWLNWGISQYLPLKKDNSLLLEVGPAGYYEWQISDSTGSQVNNSSARSQVSGVGGQVGLTCVPWNLVLNFHGFYEYHAEQRVQGASFGLNIIKKF